MSEINSQVMLANNVFKPIMPRKIERWAEWAKDNKELADLLLTAEDRAQTKMAL